MVEPSRRILQAETVLRMTPVAATLALLAAGGLPAAPIEVPFELEAQMIVVKGSINGTDSHKLILDTGATATVIVPPVAKALGIRSTPAGGSQATGRLETLSLGGAVVRDLPIFIFDPPQAISLRLDHGLDYHGLVGYTFLSQFVTTIDYWKKTLVFTPYDQFHRSPPSAPTADKPIPFHIVNRHIHVTGTLNGKGPATFLFDTGATETLLTLRTAKQLQLESQPMTHPPEARFARLDSLGIGEMKKENLTVVIYDPPHVKEYGINFDAILGHSFISQYKVTIDYRRKEMFLTPNPGETPATQTPNDDATD